MRNVINYPIDFRNIPDEVKIYLYIHDDLLENYPCKNLNEKLVKIENSEIKTAPFWEDERIYTNDQEIDYLINLEANEMKKYLEKKDSFGIFVRETVKEKLMLANEYFNSLGYEIVIKIWYRPLEVQRNLFKKVYDFFSKKYKNLSEKDIYNKTAEFVADPDKFVAPHLTGGAVDILLIRKNWERVNMGCDVNYIGEKANMTTFNITENERKNREFLALWMLKFWFANLASEWWHFSYWDPYWAYFYWEKKFLYNMVDF